MSVAEHLRLKDSGITIFRENGGNNSTKYNWRRKMSSHPDWYNNVYTHSWDYKAQTIAGHFPDAQAIFGLQLIGKSAKTNQHNFNDWGYNQSKWWDGVHQNLAGSGIVNPSGGGLALAEGNPELYLMDWPADSTVEIFDLWFGENGLGLDQNQFAYWCMDNEPSIWEGTHDDIAKESDTAEDYFQKYLKVAKAARAKFPAIKLIGPILANEWQWYNWHNKRVAYKGETYSTLEYFILRIGEEQKATGIRLLDVLAIHFYPGNTNVFEVVQFHRVFFDQSYHYPDANGVKTINGGWDNSITTEYIFKRALGWMEKHIGEDHKVGLGMTETGVNITDQNGVAVWYASTLGEFMKYNVEIFTPWSWQPAMWEVVNVFTGLSYDTYYDAVSNNEELVSAYTTADLAKAKVTSILVNRSTESAQDVILNMEGRYVDKGSVKAYQLSNLGREETFKSDIDNALIETNVKSSSSAITITMPPLSVVAITFNTSTEVLTGFQAPFRSNTFRVYPSPCQSGFLTIEYDDVQAKHISLFSADGKEIRYIANPSHEIDLRHLAPGLYFLHINSDKGTFAERILINY
ncbi:MAG: T9SS type A sorting domain-containing protein [Cyclobacteriaceae bacterium]|nr:T9SS type A sorting domain-containing protein [Cyclobacteriaceae bacterium]